MKRVITITAAVVAAAMLSGCAGMVRLTSNPDGATISLNGGYIGETPTNYEVRDKFGWFSVYSFTATKTGFRPETKAVQERTPFDDANTTVPPHIRMHTRKCWRIFSVMRGDV